MGGDKFQVSCLKNSSQAVLQDMAIGDSVAVDGVCLTVEEILLQGFVATASPETLNRTTLGYSSKAAAYVNLETSVRVGSKLGGHFVTGHVDGIGCLKESLQTATSWEMCFIAPEQDAEGWQWQIGRYIVPKGSIAVNGISLTVADCNLDGSCFKVAVIPHTYAETNLCYLEAGGLVNLEADILGKYVERLLAFRAPTSTSLDGITTAFLAEHGYL